MFQAATRTAGDLAGRVGSSVMAVAFDVGGFALIMWRALRALLPPRIDTDELVRCTYSFGIKSLPIIMATAAFVGGIMVLQAALYVRILGAYSLVGWMSGWSVMREVGPVFIGLMFSGRVGANNTAELATMTVTEQVTALRVLAIDPYHYLVIPRLFAMIGTLAALVVFGDVASIVAGMGTAYAMLGVEPSTFWTSLVTYTKPEDFLIGVSKAAVFGSAIAIASSHYGLTVRGGAQAVGRAVNAQVVGSAVLIFVLDFLMTSVVQ